MNNLITIYKNRFLIITVMLFTANILFSQVAQEWLRVYSGPPNLNDQGTCIKVDPAGNSYVGGIYSPASAAFDAMIIKYNSAGIQQWVRTYNGPGNSYDALKSIAIDASGNVYAAGMSTGVASNNDLLVIKYNSAGVQQWVMTYNGPANLNDYANEITLDDLGNVYAAGYSNSTVTNSDYITVKINSAGTQQWAVRYEGVAPYNGTANTIAVDDFGFVYVSGSSYAASGNFDIVTLKYSPAGSQMWSASYDGPGHFDDGGYSISLDGSGNIIIGGYSVGNGSDYDYCVIKYSAGGSQIWVSRYNGPGNSTDYIFSMALGSSNSIYVTGMSFGSSTGADYCTVKYDSLGIQQWVSRYNGSASGNNSDWSYSIVLDASGNSYIAGYSDGTSTGHDCCVVKYNSSGVEQWVQRYGTNGDDRLAEIGLDTVSNVYVTGWVASSTSFDCLTIKYSQTSGIQQISGQVPDGFSLSQNYPNPFNPTTKIRFAILANVKGETSNTKIIIFDILGREVATLVNEQLNPGTYEVDFDATNFPSGIYFCVMKTESFTDTRKMILIK